MAWIKTIPVTDLSLGKRQVTQANGRRVLLINHQNKIHAIEPYCPHLRLPLKKAHITEEDILTCPWHHSAFDLNSGEVKAWSPWPPCIGKMLGVVTKERPLSVFRVKIEDAHVWVEVV